jgi:ABC-type phosphate/phosphonate transport system substrate-binding protein
MNPGGQQMTRRQCLTLLAGAGVAALSPKPCRAEKGGNLLCLGISINTLAGVNVDDARAAYLALINEYDSGHGGEVSAEVVPGAFISSADLTQDVRQGTVQCFCVTALEYAKLADLVDPEVLVLQDYLADGIEYVVLVQNNSPFKKIGDLRGAQMLLHRDRDTVLVPSWLEVMLAADSLPGLERFFGSMLSRDKLNQVVLPVFFHHADAACVTRRNWDTALELNPQLGRNLHILAVSPRLIPIAIAFRRKCNSTGRKLLVDSMVNLTNTAAGRQMAALYQTNRFVQRPTSVMQTTLELIRQSERLSAQQTGLRKGHS